MNSDHAIPNGWKHTSLGDSCSLIRDGTHLPPARVENGPLLLSVQNMIAGWLQTTPNDTRVSWDFYKQMHRTWCVQPKDVLLAIVGATIGKVCRIPDNIPPFTLQRSVAVLRGDDTSLLSEFLYWVVSDELFTQQIWQRANQTAQPGLYLAEIQQLRLLLPSLPEQRKINRILTTLDKLIKKTENLIAKYQAIKQGMMHDLFTRGVDAHGHLRPTQTEAPDHYKESELGWIPKEWEIGTIGEQFDIRLGKMLSRASKTGRSPYPYLANRNVQWDRVDTTSLESMDFTASEKEKFSLLKDDILVCEGGEVGRTAIWQNELEECFYQKAIHRLRPLLGTMIPRFMLRFMRHAALMGWFTDFMSQTSIAHLTREKLAVVPILLPHSAEQKDISERIDGVDAILTNERAYQSKLAEKKTGLMQDLLTGKVRVKVDETEEVAHV